MVIALIAVLSPGGLGYSLGHYSDTFGGGKDRTFALQNTAAGMFSAVHANPGKNDREIRHSTAESLSLSLLFAVITNIVSCKKPLEGFKLFWKFSPVNVKK